MADNLTLHRSPDYTKPVVEMKPAAFDLVVKVIRMSGLSHVYIAESVLHGLIQNNDKEAERLFHIIQSDFSKIRSDNMKKPFRFFLIILDQPMQNRFAYIYMT